MPGYASIVNHLLRLLPDDASADLYNSALKLSAQSENYFDPAVRDDAVSGHVSAWHTRLAVEALRGWNWPYWINAQINPASPSFCGGGFQGDLKNLMCRDAACVPGIDGRFAGTIDRRGMVTPTGGRFSIETWFRLGDEIFVPGQVLDESQITFKQGTDSVAIEYTTQYETIAVTATAHTTEDFEYLKISGTIVSDPEHVRPSAIYFSIRPYNLESVAPVHDLVYNSKGFWMSENRIIGWFSSRPHVSWASDARHGDSALFLSAPPERTAVRCAAGMATAVSAFHFPNAVSHPATAEIVIPLKPAYPREFPFPDLIASGNVRSLLAIPSKQLPEPQSRTARLISDSHSLFRSLTDVTTTEVQRLLLHCPSMITAVIKAFLALGDRRCAARVLSYCAFGIEKNGYLLAGRGQWAFQGQFLAALADYYQDSGAAADETILRYSQIKSAARWIVRKRQEISYAPNKPKGLLPPGVTRDSIGSEYQLTDNIWALEGLEAAKSLARLFNAPTDADAFHNDAVRYAAQINSAIHRELEYGISQQVPARLHHAFDAASAAELLDIALADEARTLLKPDEWLARLIEILAEPLSRAAKSENSIDLLRMDERGLRPARRIMLHLAHNCLAGEWRKDADHIHKLMTPMGSWTECLHPGVHTGCGRLIHDPEAAGLYVIMMSRMQKLDLTANNRGV